MILGSLKERIARDFAHWVWKRRGEVLLGGSVNHQRYEIGKVYPWAAWGGEHIMITRKVHWRVFNNSPDEPQLIDLWGRIVDAPILARLQDGPASDDMVIQLER